MEKQFKTVTVVGKEYQVVLYTGKNGFMVDRLVMGLFFGASGKKMTDEEMGIEIMRSISTLDEDEYMDLVISSLKGVSYVGNENEQARNLDEDYIFEYFKGKLTELYELLMGVWRVNKLTPFPQQDGSQTETTATSPQQPETNKSSLQG